MEGFICMKESERRRYQIPVRLNPRQLRQYGQLLAVRKTWEKQPVIGMDISEDEIRMAVFLNGIVKNIRFSDGTEYLSCAAALNADKNRMLTGERAKQYIEEKTGSGINGLIQMMESSWCFSGNSKAYEPEELMGFLFQRARNEAQKFLGTDVTDVVVALSSAYSSSQCRLIMRAMKRTGWRVKKTGHTAGFIKIDETYRFRRKISASFICCPGKSGIETGWYLEEDGIVEEQDPKWETWKKSISEWKNELTPKRAEEAADRLICDIRRKTGKQNSGQLFICGESAAVSEIIEAVRKKAPEIKIIVIARACAAKGAAVYAAVLEKKTDFEQLYLQSAVYDIRVSVWGTGHQEVILERGTVLPCKQVRTFRKRFEKGRERSAEIEIRQGNRENFTENTLIARTTMGALGLERQGERIDTGESVYGSRIQICVQEDSGWQPDKDEITITVKDMITGKTRILDHCD